jgi:hypothetical protein
MTAPQGNGAPAPPSPSSLLADFDPTRHREDRAGGGWTGTIPSPVAHAYTFDGSSNYAAATSPPVVDHSAAVPYTVYAVVRPSAADVAGTTTLCSSGIDGSNYWTVQYRPSGVLRILVAAGGLFSLNDATPSLVAGTTYVLAFEFASLTELNIWVDGVEDTATVTSRDPGNLLDFSWGRGSPLSQSPFYSSNTLLRGLVYSGAYDAEITAYLQGLYSPARIPPGVASSDVLFLWDPEASYRRDWAGTWQTITPSGTVTESVRAGHKCATLASTAYYTVPTSPIPTYADEVPYTVYAVAETTSDGKTQSYLFQVTAANILGGSANAILRDTASTGALSVVYTNAGALSQAASHSGTGIGATPGTVYSVTAEFGASALQAWMDGFSSGSVAHAASPTGMTNCYMGGSGTATGGALNEGCVLYYVCAVRGTRDTAIEAWLAANFPVGETP